MIEHQTPTAEPPAKSPLDEQQLVHDLGRALEAMDGPGLHTERLDEVVAVLRRHGIVS
jgi:hypothetical protein